MSLKSIVILIVVVLLIFIAVFEWFLCIALSRSERRMEKSQDHGDEQEDFSKGMSEKECEKNQDG